MIKKVGNKFDKTQQNPKKLPNIILNYKQDKELFSSSAEKWADLINRTKKTQVRNFYDYILEYDSKAKTEEWDDVLPFVKMLGSKVEYAVTRKVATYEFKSMINQCVKQVNTKDDLRVFKLFFESVLGYYKGRD